MADNVLHWKPAVLSCLERFNTVHLCGRSAQDLVYDHSRTWSDWWSKCYEGKISTQNQEELRRLVDTIILHEHDQFARRQASQQAQVVKMQRQYEASVSTGRDATISAEAFLIELFQKHLAG